ncbi:MAG TPA: CBS domain-containing protein [Trichormus sp.]
MEIVLTHNNMDFDSLAAQFGVTKLYPSARMVLGFPLTGNVRDFLALYRSSLPISQIKYLDLSRVTKVFIVDCQHLERLDETAKSLFQRNGQRIPVTIFDHHALDAGGLGSHAEPDSIIQSVGAATTLVVDKIRQRNISLTPFEATLLAIGIYEDTGCLTYSGTTELDASCIAFLLKCGVDLAIVNDFIHPKLNEPQTQLLQDLIKSSLVLNLHGSKVVLATSEREKYIDGLASLTRKLTEIESADAAFTIVQMRDRVHVVGRSDSRAIDVRTIVRDFGGDGHPGAGSAVVRDSTVRQVRARAESLIRSAVLVPRQAIEIMTSPVITVLPTVPMDEAGRIMIRHRIDGLIVAEDEQIVGVVTQRDIAQAVHHKLGHAPVRGFMSKPVITIGEDATLTQIQKLMIDEDIGRLPVLSEQGKLLGVVSRQELLKTLYGNQSDVRFSRELERHPQRTVKNFAHLMKTIEPTTLSISQDVGRAAEQLNMVAYAVGGFVRDLILGRPNYDLDYVIEGNAIELADAMEQAFPGIFKVVKRHDRFQTATLEYTTSGAVRSVDFSTARLEFYEYPAALPMVEPSKLDQDLSRRDFTINALAMCLNPKDFGELIDEFDGLTDLEQKIIRVLHPFSFIEDPTRIIRAVRFAARLGFNLDAETAEQARNAIAIGIFDDLGGTRMREELKLILESPRRRRALKLLSQLGARLRYLDAELQYTLEVDRAIRWAEKLLAGAGLKDPWVVFLGLLLSRLPGERVWMVLDRLHMTNEHKLMIEKAFSVREELPRIFEELNRNRHGLKDSEIYHLLHGKPDESLAIVACLGVAFSPVRRIIQRYLVKLRNVKVELTGNDLIALGIKQGREIGKVLGALLDARLDGLINDREGELRFARENFLP